MSTPARAPSASPGRATLPEARQAALAALLLLGAAPPDACADLHRLATPTLAITQATREGAMCRVSAVARPRRGSAIGIELWLPPARQWSGRYYQMGNGGFAGHIDGATLAAAAGRGDVAAATDTGHQAGGFDARWAAGRRDLVDDYAWRSIKATSDAARLLTRGYYGRDARRRYFMGCSFGGRQALVAAARWPQDWDGVIAGAPATRWAQRLTAFARIGQALRGESQIAPERLPTLIAAARRVCGAGGTLSCSRRALTAGCRSGDTQLCVSGAQARALAVLDRAGYPLAGADARGWATWVLDRSTTATTQAAFADQARHLFGRSRAVPRWAAQTFAVGSLRAFAAKGGRVLSYFGTADPVLPPARAVDDARSVGADSGFYRLLLIPDMLHCQGGDAPHAIGQSLPALAAADDAAHDLRRALEAWVEAGRAPDALIATTPGAPTRTALLRPTPL